MSEPSQTPARISWLVGGMAVYGSADALCGAARLALAALYTRLLSPAEFGLLAVIQVTVAILIAALPLGLPDVLAIRFRLSDPAQMRREKDRVFSLLLAGCFVAAALAIALVTALPAAAAWKRIVPWAALWVTVSVLWFVPTQSLRYSHRTGRYATARITQVAAMIAALLWLVRNGGGIEQIIIAEAIGGCVALGLSLALDGYLPRIRAQDQARALLVAGSPFCLLAFTGILMDLADRYVIASILGVEATGFYAVAGRIAVIGSLLTTALVTMWQPFFYREAAAGAIDPARVRRVSRSLVLLFSTGVALGMTALPYVLTIRVMGRWFVAPAYHGAIVIVAPLMFQYVLKALYFISAPAINFNNRTWLQLGVTSACGAAGIAINAAVAGAAPLELYPKLVAMALVSALSFAPLVYFGIAQMRALYPGADIGWKFATITALVALPPLLGLPWWLSAALVAAAATATALTFGLHRLRDQGAPR